MGTTYATKEEAIAAARREPGRTRQYLLKVYGGRYASAPDTWGYDHIAVAFRGPRKGNLPRIVGHISSATFVDFLDRKMMAR